jgi:hypothetical protein
VYADRRGADRRATVVVGENPHLELVPAESTGVPLTADQRRFRDAWLGPRPALPPTPPPPR